MNPFAALAVPVKFSASCEKWHSATIPRQAAAVKGPHQSKGPKRGEVAAKALAAVTHEWQSIPKIAAKIKAGDTAVSTALKNRLDAPNPPIELRVVRNDSGRPMKYEYRLKRGA